MSQDYKRRIFVFFTLLLMVIVIVGISKVNYSISKEITLTKAKPFILKDMNGKTIKLSDFIGKAVIIDFFATWCPPCRSEIPHFVDLHKKYSKKGFVMLGIGLDADDKANMNSFIKKYAIKYPILVADEKVKKDYGGIRSIPTTFVINKKGQIYKKYIGYEEKKIFENDILSILK